MPASPAPGYRESHEQCGCARPDSGKLRLYALKTGIDKRQTSMARIRVQRAIEPVSPGRSVASDKDRRRRRWDSTTIIVGSDHSELYSDRAADLYSKQRDAFPPSIQSLSNPRACFESDLFRSTETERCVIELERLLPGPSSIVLRRANRFGHQPRISSMATGGA